MSPGLRSAAVGRYAFLHIPEIAAWPRSLRGMLALTAPLVARLAPTWIYVLRRRAAPSR